MIPWFVAEPLLLRLTTALAAGVGVAAAATLRRWDASAGLNVAELKRARASAEWQHEERVAELEADLEEGRELRRKLEQRLRSKRAELAALRNEHASLLRRYATAETERASALEGRRLLEIEAADPVPELPPARETRALGPAPAPEPVRPFSPQGGGLFRQAIEALDSLEALQAAAGAEDVDLDLDPVAEEDAEEDAEAVLDAGVDTGVDADAGVTTALGDAESATEPRPDAAERAASGSAADGPAVAAADEDTAEEAAETPVGADGARGFEDTAGAHGVEAGARVGATVEQEPQDAAGASAAEASAVAGAQQASGGDGAETRGAEGEPGGPAAGVTTAKPVRPSGGHFTVPTAVAVVPAAPAPRRPAGEGGFDFFGNKRSDTGVDGDHGGHQPSPAPSGQGREAEPRPQQPQPLIRPQQTQHRADVGRVVDVDAKGDDLHAAS